MAPAHSAKSSIQKLEVEDFDTWEKGEWPGNIPDFNVIEHIRTILQDSVLKSPDRLIATN